MVYGDLKDLARRTASDKVLRDKTFNIAKNPRCDGCQRGLAFMAYKCLIKSQLVNKSAFNNEKLGDELHKSVARNFKKRTVYSGFKDNIWGADLADMQLISKFNKGFRFLLCVIDNFSKYAWVVPLKDKKVKALLMHFKRSYINQDLDKTKYGLTKEVNFTIVLLRNG